MIRVFSLPDMKAIDGGGLTVFSGDTSRAPMGVAIYRRPRDGQVFAIVGGKSGPKSGYLAQYALGFADGRVTAALTREFGTYSGRKEIEAIVVDDDLGYVYYSDEQVGVRKYHADPDSGTAELALFATSGVTDDHEGLAIYRRDQTSGYIVLSDQGANRIRLSARGRAGRPTCASPAGGDSRDGAGNGRPRGHRAVAWRGISDGHAGDDVESRGVPFLPLSGVTCRPGNRLRCASAR
ncbi:MAG: phytase [Gemmatimonadaceae bacterium]|nr:phytase [Gemmatimonadaceae bacterium]